MKIKELAYRFFDNDISLCKSVKLTKEEIKKFENFEWEVLYHNGLKNINGGFSVITVHDVDEEYIYCWAKCGVQSDCDNNTNSWKVKFDRKNKVFEED